MGWSQISLVAIALGFGCGAEPESEGLEIAVLVPFAESGPMSDARRAWQLSLEAIGEGGGVGGRALSVRERDVTITAADDLRGLTDGFLELTEDGHKFIISMLPEAELAPIMDAAMPSNVLALSITAEDSTANLPGYDGLLLRGILPTDRLIQKQAELLQGRGLARMAVIAETIGGLPDGRAEAMAQSYADCAACALTRVSFAREADLYAYDWRGFGGEVMAEAPEVVFLATANVPALLDAVRSIHLAGFEGHYYFAYGAFMSTLAPAFATDGVRERFRSLDLALPPSDQLTQFFNSYDDRFGDTPVPEPRVLAFADYVTLLALAMSSVGADDARDVSRALRELASPPGEPFGPLEYGAAAAAVRAGRDIDFTGLSGSFNFDARGDAEDGLIQEYGVDASGDVYAL